MGELISDLIGRSSLGDEDAVRRRSRVPRDVVRGILEKSARLSSCDDIGGPRPSDEGDSTMASPHTNRHVVPNPSGGWDVKAPGAERASSHHATQADAERRAKTIVANAGGGEVRIHNRQGRIRDSDTVRPGRDPFPPRDRRR